MAEILSGARAAPMGACPRVREIGAMLVSAHTRLDATGAAIALLNGAMLPLTPNPDETQQLLSTGMKMGRDFDLAWLPPWLVTPSRSSSTT
jgi:putative membrane protein